MPGSMQVRELMSTDLVTLTEDETLAHAQRCMARGRIRHLPVVRDGRLVGLLTHRDLLAASFSIFAEVEPRRAAPDLRHRAGRRGDAPGRGDRRSRPFGARGGPTSCSRTSTAASRWSSDSGQLVGILTEADFLRLTVRLLRMTVLDWALLVVWLGITLSGFWKGAVRIVFGIGGSIAGLWLALALGGDAAALLAGWLVGGLARGRARPGAAGRRLHRPLPGRRLGDPPHARGAPPGVAQPARRRTARRRCRPDPAGRAARQRGRLSPALSERRATARLLASRLVRIWERDGAALRLTGGRRQLRGGGSTATARSAR